MRSNENRKEKPPLICQRLTFIHERDIS